MTLLARAVGAVAVMAVALPAYSQSLGDVARQEEARRASAAKAVKTLSNADLGPSEITQITQPPGAAAVESCYVSKSKGRCVSPEELVSISNTGVVTKANASFEPNWRSDAQAIRAQLEGARHGVTVLEATVADEERSAGERKAAEKALMASRHAVAHYERQWEKLEQAASNQHIPRAWIEPIPTLTTRKPQ